MSTKAETSSWEHIESLIQAGDPSALALAVDDLDLADRVAIAKSLRAFVRELSAQPRPDPGRREAMIAVVGAGVLLDARSLGSWLTRHSINYHVEAPEGHRGYEHRNVVAQVMFLLTRRSLGWLPDLVTDLAGRLPKDPRYHWYNHRFELVVALLGVTGQPPPLDDGFVVGWAVRSEDGTTAAASIEADPRLAALIPRLFELDEVGALFDGSAHWPGAIAELGSRNLVEPAVLLDACIARLGRDGRPGASRGYLHVLEALAPSQSEQAARSAGYQAMLSAELSTIATHAQTTLHELDRSGLLKEEHATEAARIVLGRPEKKLVRAELAFLATSRDVRAASAAELIVGALPGLPPDIARAAIGALKAISKHLSAEQTTHVHLGIAGLPRDLAVEAGNALGTSNAPVKSSKTPPAAARKASWAPKRLEPISDLTELAAEVAALIDWNEPGSPTRLERVLEGLIHWTRVDPSALAATLDSPAIREHVETQSKPHTYSHNATFAKGIAGLLALAIGAPPSPRHPVDRNRLPSVDGVVVERLFAIEDALRSGVPGYPVSRPTWDSGLIAPDDLVARLRAAADAGVGVWPVELEQALLRVAMPSDLPERRRLADELALIGTDAARTAATWVSVGLPTEPALTAATVRRQHLNYNGEAKKEWLMSVISVRATGSVEDESVVWRGLTTLDPAPLAAYQVTDQDQTRARRFVPWLAPRHRELLAAHIMDRTSSSQGLSNIALPLLPALAAGDGPFGEAMALALIYGYASDRDDARAYAVAATLTLGDRQILEPELLGRLAGSLAAERTVVLVRLVTALRALADAGGDSVAWSLLRSALPALLGGERVVPGTPDALSLAAEVVERSDARGAVVGLDEFAARKGSSRQLVEARRLQRLLNPA